MFVEKQSLITAVVVIFTAVFGVILNSSLVCRLCVAFLLCICILNGMREKNFFNPYYLFALVPFTLLIYANISKYHMDLTINTWLIAIINIAAFIIALQFTPEYKHVEHCIGVGDGRQLITHTIEFLIIGFIPTIYSFVTGTTIPFAYVFTLFLSVAIICALKSKSKLLIFCTLALIVLSWIKYVSKTSVLSCILSVLIGYERYFVLNSKQKKKLVVFIAAGIILMILAFSFANQNRGVSTASGNLAYYTTNGNLVWNGNAYLMMPYMYLTTPWSNLQYVMETQTEHTYGLWLVKPFLGYFGVDELLSHFYELKPYSSFNTFTYIAVCFKDFGFYGSCISSVILGYFLKKIYSRSKISMSPLDVACYAAVAQAVVEMFFSNHFFAQSYPFTIVIIMGVYKWLFCRKNTPELNVEVFDKYLE